MLRGYVKRTIDKLTYSYSLSSHHYNVLLKEVVNDVIFNMILFHQDIDNIICNLHIWSPTEIRKDLA